MSLPLPPEPSNGIILTIKIIKAQLPESIFSSSPSIAVKLGSLTWQTYKPQNAQEKNDWNKTHTFELSEVANMRFTVNYKTGIFKESELCSTELCCDVFSSKKGVRYTEIVNLNAKVVIIWGFFIEENRKVENYEYLKMINEVEVEREEVKFFKNKIRAKLERVKEKNRVYKEQMKNVIENVEGLLEYQC